MLYHLRIEDIKDSLSGNRWERYIFAKYDHGRRNLKSSAWVARLSKGKKGKVEREFVEQYRDFHDGSKNGGRGIYKDFFLDDGVYEISEPVDWYDVRRYYVLVCGGEMMKISRKDAELWLR